MGEPPALKTKVETSSRFPKMVETNSVTVYIIPKTKQKFQKKCRPSLLSKFLLYVKVFTEGKKTHRRDDNTMDSTLFAALGTSHTTTREENEKKQREESE